MTRSIRVHQRFPIEMGMVGRLLTRYADLEIALLNTVQKARRADLDATLKTMFRARAITQRIDIADGLGRQVGFQTCLRLCLCGHLLLHTLQQND